MRILGISAFYHDSAAALLEDDHIIAAAQEERFTRKKQDARYPECAIRYCLDEGGLTLDDVDHIVFYEKPFGKFERLLETYLAFAPRGFGSFRMALPLWLKKKLFQKDLLGRRLKARAPDFDWQHKLLFAEHHMSHAASAFYPSPFDEALILRCWRVGHHERRDRSKSPDRHAQGNPLPPLARLALRGLHLLHRLQGKLGRIQSYGIGALRRAPICQCHP